MRTLRPAAPFSLRAPAKINLGLEVLGKRPDGYHDIVTILQTVSIYDTIEVSPAGRLRYVSTGRVNPDTDLALRAITVAREALGIELIASVRLRKAIPVSAGLGGGSSDAGTMLSVLATCAGLGLHEAESAAATLGSDVPFFVRGGTALATGTGTSLEALRATRAQWLVVATPRLRMPSKTRRMYAALSPSDFSDGHATLAQAERIRSGSELDPALLVNTFTRPLLEIEPLRRLWDAFTTTSPLAIIPAGAGPSLVAFYPSNTAARDATMCLEAVNARVMLCQTVGPGLNDAAVLEERCARQPALGVDDEKGLG